MVDTTRRGFFRLAAGAAAAVAVANLPSHLAEAAPILWADGVHDDAAALNALIRGGVVRFAHPEKAALIGWRGNALHLGGFRIRVESPIIFNPAAMPKMPIIRDMRLEGNLAGPVAVFLPRRPTHPAIPLLSYGAPREC
jgi:hypothetical protein